MKYLTTEGERELLRWCHSPSWGGDVTDAQCLQMLEEAWTNGEASVRGESVYLPLDARERAVMFVLCAAHATEEHRFRNDESPLPTEVEIHVYLTDHLDSHDLDSGDIGCLLRTRYFELDDDDDDDEDADGLEPYSRALRSSHLDGIYNLTSHGFRTLKMLAEHHRRIGQVCSRVTEIRATRHDDHSLRLVFTRGRVRKERLVPRFRTWLYAVADDDLL